MNKGDTVKIIIEGYQLVDGEKSDVNRVSAQGVIADIGEGIFVNYKETVEGCSELVNNTLCIYDEEVTVKKSGPITSDLYLKENESCMLHYNTPFGKLDMLVECKTMEIVSRDDRIIVKAIYDMYQNKQIISENYIGIYVYI